MQVSHNNYGLVGVWQWILCGQVCIHCRTFVHIPGVCFFGPEIMSEKFVSHNNSGFESLQLMKVCIHNLRGNMPLEKASAQSKSISFIILFLQLQYMSWSPSSYQSVTYTPCVPWDNDCVCCYHKVVIKALDSVRQGKVSIDEQDGLLHLLIRQLLLLRDLAKRDLARRIVQCLSLHLPKIKPAQRIVLDPVYIDVKLRLVRMCICYSFVELCNSRLLDGVDVYKKPALSFSVMHAPIKTQLQEPCISQTPGLEL